MLKKCLLYLTSIITLIAILGVTACKLPSADEMRQPDYGGSTEAEVAQAVIDDIATLFDGIRAGDTEGPITRTFTEAQLTALLAQKVSTGDGGISSILINIESDAILMACELANEGETKEVVAEFTLTANGDTVALTLGDFTWGGLLASIVPAARTAFIDQLNSGLQTAMGDTEVTMDAIPVPEGATVDNIVLSEGEMTITGTVTAEVLTE